MGGETIRSAVFEILSPGVACPIDAWARPGKKKFGVNRKGDSGGRRSRTAPGTESETLRSVSEADSGDTEFWLELMLPGRRRMRIARGVDRAALGWLTATVRPGSGARLELVYANGKRLRVANGVDEKVLRSLLAIE